jgi:hypothetical protein
MVEEKESSASSSRLTLQQNSTAHTLNALGNGQQNAGNKRLAVVRLLENDDLLSETRTGDAKLVSADDASLSWSGDGCDVRSGLLVLEGSKLDSLDVHDGGSNSADQLVG